MEILATSKVHQNRIFIPKEVREVMDIKDGEQILWKYDNVNKLLLISKQNPKSKYRFIHTPGKD